MVTSRRYSISVDPQAELPEGETGPLTLQPDFKLFVQHLQNLFDMGEVSHS